MHLGDIVHVPLLLSNLINGMRYSTEILCSNIIFNAVFWEALMALSWALLLDFNLLKLEVEREEPGMGNRECGTSKGKGKMKIEKKKEWIADYWWGQVCSKFLIFPFLVLVPQSPIHDPRSPISISRSQFLVRQLRKGINFSFWETAHLPLP